MRTFIVSALSAVAVLIATIIGVAYNVTPPTPDTQVAFTASQVAADAPNVPDVTEDAGKGITLADDDRVSAGVCRTFTGRIYITVCVPLYSPFGGILDGKVYEDGSASYSDGWVIDSESREFYKGDCWAENVGTEDAPNIIAASANTSDGLCHN